MSLSLLCKLKVSTFGTYTLTDRRSDGQTKPHIEVGSSLKNDRRLNKRQNSICPSVKNHVKELNEYMHSPLGKNADIIYLSMI